MLKCNQGGCSGSLVYHNESGQCGHYEYTVKDGEIIEGEYMGSDDTDRIYLKCDECNIKYDLDWLYENQEVLDALASR